VELNGGAWSAEQAVGVPLTLAGLPAGTNTVAILGRSQYGGYLAAGNALTVSRVVSSGAAATVVTGMPAPPPAGPLTVDITGCQFPSVCHWCFPI